MSVECVECMRPVGDGLALCTTCGAGLVAELAAVPGLLADLTVMRSGLDRLAAARDGGRAAENPIPVRATDHRAVMRGDRALDRVSEAVMRWAGVLAATLGADVPIGAPGLIQLVQNARTRRGATEPAGPAPRRRAPLALCTPYPDPAAVSATPASPVEQAAVWLANHPHELRAHAGAARMKIEVSRAVEQLRRAVDRPVERRYLGPCPALLPDGRPCLHELRVESGRAWVRCERCRQQHEVAAIEAATRQHAENQVWTLADLLHILAAIGTPVPSSTLYRWARQHRITARGWQHTGPDGARRITDHAISAADDRVYRLGDVLALASQETTETGAAQ